MTSAVLDRIGGHNVEAGMVLRARNPGMWTAVGASVGTAVGTALGNSPIGLAYRQMARRTAATLATLNKDYSRLFPKISVEST